MVEPPKRMLQPQRAYQGEISGRMRLVLGLSLLLAIGTVGGLAVEWRDSHAPTEASQPGAGGFTPGQATEQPPNPPAQPPSNAPSDKH